MEWKQNEKKRIKAKKTRQENRMENQEREMKKNRIAQFSICVFVFSGNLFRVLLIIRINRNAIAFIFFFYFFLFRLRLWSHNKFTNKSVCTFRLNLSVKKFIRFDRFDFFFFVAFIFLFNNFRSSLSSNLKEIPNSMEREKEQNKNKFNYLFTFHSHDHVPHEYTHYTSNGSVCRFRWDSSSVHRHNSKKVLFNFPFQHSNRLQVSLYRWPDSRSGRNDNEQYDVQT